MSLDSNEVARLMQGRRDQEGRKVSSGDKSLLRLVAKGADMDGWAKVSRVVAPLIIGLPAGLVEFEQSADGSGMARLTETGRTVLEWA